MRGLAAGCDGSRRTWTQSAVLCQAAHVFYELAAGVGLPFASRVGAGPAAGLWALSSAGAWRAAGRQARSRDPVFAVVDGVCLAAVVAHLSSWPGTRTGGLPWLRECEGLTGRVMPAYNVLLYAGAAAAVGGLLENRRALGAGLVPLLLVGWLGRQQHVELVRLRRQALERPRWWNRRLQPTRHSLVLDGPSLETGRPAEAAPRPPTGLVA